MASSSENRSSTEIFDNQNVEEEKKRTRAIESYISELLADAKWKEDQASVPADPLVDDDDEPQFLNRNISVITREIPILEYEIGALRHDRRYEFHGVTFSADDLAEMMRVRLSSRRLDLRHLNQGLRTDLSTKVTVDTQRESNKGSVTLPLVDSISNTKRNPESMVPSKLDKRAAWESGAQEARLQWEAEMEDFRRKQRERYDAS